ncbi:uncharacterized protein CMU_029270 [Cryptosporidium muris RN66]|uniref:Signal recognition particle subunit SRP68 n=1 Tax=Cryptosporidium muris (strain RN66) TaxID=441375 RepID=B6AI12_CRYMR|nr:uncharacterized protein CMU_029270 [Cryptosporidium muris RN66]EEA07853.1 hypothetical protein, conserved [Cryptosporidium muris RN66]|eukprot:XP_002142202.1 hypothetical protein [Cryptosporidium muris RN66]
MEIEDTIHGDVNIDNNLNNITYEVVPFDLPLLIIVKTLRKQNGLRHKDYSRYRRYCTRRLHHLRSCLRMTCGRNKFQSRPIEIDDVKNPRHLLILISLIERNWSYSNEISNGISNEISTSHKDRNNLSSNEIRSRYHIIRRLRKSCKYSDLLLKVSEEKCTARSIVEVQAYRNNLMGNYYIQCSDWVKGAVSLINCKKLYQQLKLDLNASSIDMNKILPLYNIDSMSKNDYLKIYDDHIEELEPLIRLCLYHCNRLGIDIESMENLDDNPKIEIESHLTNNMGMKIFFNGSEYPLIFPRAEMYIMELHECYNQTKKILSTEEDTLLSISTNSIIEAYSDVLMDVSTINSMIHEEITNLTVKNGVSPLNSLNSEEWSALEGYIRTFQIFITTERDLVLLYRLLSYFNSPDFLLINIINQGIIPKALNSNKDTEIRYPEEGIRLCDFLKMTISEIKSVGEELFKRKEVTMLVEKLNHIVDNCRCLLLSHIYGLLGKFHEAYLLSDLVKSRSDSTIFKLEVIEWDHDGYISRVISLYKHLHDVISQMIPVNCSVYRAYIVKYQNKDSSQIYSNTEDLKYDILRPSYIPIPVKPIMFDIAADYITPPNLSSRYKKEGIVNRMISKATSGFGIFKRN